MGNLVEANLLSKVMKNDKANLLLFEHFLTPFQVGRIIVHYSEKRVFNKLMSFIIRIIISISNLLSTIL